MISDQGRLILVGVLKSGDSINIFSLPLHLVKKQQAHLEESVTQQRTSLDTLNDAKRVMGFKGLITESYDLENINEAIFSMRKEKIRKSNY